jgi:magnesium-protoporphyrin O-methyltransferase
MTSSCSTCGISRQFGSAKAAKNLRRYQRKGPDPTTRMLIDAMMAQVRRSQLSEMTLLDIGGGVGILHHELIDGVVRDAVHIDVSPDFIAVARQGRPPQSRTTGSSSSSSTSSTARARWSPLTWSPWIGSSAAVPT